MQAMVAAGGSSMRQQAVVVATGGRVAGQSVMTGCVTRTTRNLTSVMTPPYTVPKGPWGENR